MYELPTTVTVDNVTYKIRHKGDYRLILDIINVLQDDTLSNEEQSICSIILFYESVNCPEDVFKTFKDLKECTLAISNFIGMNKPNIGYATSEKVLDWIEDEHLIVSAINQQINTEVRALPYMHWWTFLSYFLSLGDCTLATVIRLRNKINKHTKLDKWESEFIKNNPEYFTKHNTAKSEDDFEQTIKDLWQTK